MPSVRIPVRTRQLLGVISAISVSVGRLVLEYVYVCTRVRMYGVQRGGGEVLC
jgi:hypothetical protein